MTYEQSLAQIGRAYTIAAAKHGGRSLSRVTTIVVNQGAFFSRVEDGKTFTVRNLDRLAAFFCVPDHWPGGYIPDEARAALAQIGRPALRAA